MTRWFFCINQVILNCFYLVLFTLIVTSVYFCYVIFIYPLLSGTVFLQRWHIKNVINSLFFRKLQLVNLLLNRIKHLKLPKKLCVELSILSGLDIFAIQLNFISGGIAFRLDAFNVGPFLKFLDIVEVLFANNYQLF